MEVRRRVYMFDEPVTKLAGDELTITTTPSGNASAVLKRDGESDRVLTIRKHEVQE